MRTLVTSCRSARIRKKTTSEIKTVINSTTYGSLDYIAIFADTPEGMQKLLNVVQGFTA